MLSDGRRLSRAACSAALVVAALCVLPIATAGAAVSRATADRPDDFQGRQIHVVYAIPSDGTDQSLDTSGAIANSVASFQRWMLQQTPNRRLRIDSSGGQVDTTFFRLAKSDAEVSAMGARAVDEMATEMTNARIVRPGKIYAIYYDGGDDAACGSGQLGGLAGALYLHGTPPQGAPCDSQQLAAPGAQPGYLDISQLHEIMHVQGFVPSCAPHETRSGHVSDSPTDLMYAGDQPWDVAHMTLDYGRDDYYEAGRPGCLELSDSAYLGPSDGTNGVALSVAESGIGAGSMASSPAGIACGDVCEHSFAQGTPVTLTARPIPGSGFAGWTGACAGTGACHVTMSTFRQVVAVFVLPPDTRITASRISAAARFARFRFRGTGGGRIGFECRMDAGRYRRCRSGTTYRRLRPGRHTFRVRARNAAGVDRSPAKRAFAVSRRRHR